MYDVPLRHITLFDGGRVTTIIHPVTGKKKTHGLGAVGDPILPFLDHRTEGYMLVILPGAESPAIHEVDTKGTPLASGKLPSKRVPWSALGADDCSPFAGAEAAK